uniref:Beta,beta-carotene 9',10'-oxygenase n=1 Tax=Angiostrongylus cantonensis TaxID=6313 RepID=A0A158PC41_ANGCA
MPTWLNGALLRNGPGMFKIGDTSYRHWFDGMAYIQRYHFVNGKMFYSARYLESDDYNENMRAQRIICTSFGTKTFPDPCKSIFFRMASYFLPNDTLDNCNVAFVTASDGVYALTESPLLIRIDVDTLERQERLDIRDYMNISLHSYSAHFHSDSDGNLYNIGSAFGRTSKYVLAVTKHPRFVKDGAHLRGMKTAELLAEIPASKLWSPSYYHSFGITENYFILFESPLRLNLKKMIFRIENPGNLDALLLEHMRTGTFRSNPNFEPYLHRMIIPLDVRSDSKPGDNLLESCDFAGECKAILKDDGSIHCTNRRLCEICSNRVPTLLLRFEHVVKVDVKDGTYKVWNKDSELQICAEPILVNKPGYTVEDEGVLIVPVVTIPNAHTPYVVILDAQTMDQLCRFLIPQPRIPLGFHSHFVPKLQDSVDEAVENSN